MGGLTTVLTKKSVKPRKKSQPEVVNRGADSSGVILELSSVKIPYY
jgi:hypothetical protein